MKRSWIGFALLLVLLAGGIAATWGMAECHEPIARDLENAAKTALQGDMARGESLMLQARDAWGRSRHLGACFAAHTPMEEIAALFAQVEVYAAAREETDFAAGCVPPPPRPPSCCGPSLLPSRSLSGNLDAMPSQSPSVTALPEGEPRGCVC